MSNFVNPGVIVATNFQGTISSANTQTIIKEPRMDELYVRILKQGWTAKSAYMRYLNDTKTFESMCRMYPERVSTT